jgi:hypothetical protein
MEEVKYFNNLTAEELEAVKAEVVAHEGLVVVKEAANVAVFLNGGLVVSGKVNEKPELSTPEQPVLEGGEELLNGLTGEFAVIKGRHINEVVALSRRLDPMEAARELFHFLRDGEIRLTLRELERENRRQERQEK